MQDEEVHTMKAKRVECGSEGPRFPVTPTNQTGQDTHKAAGLAAAASGGKRCEGSHGWSEWPFWAEEAADGPYGGIQRETESSCRLGTRALEGESEELDLRLSWARGSRRGDPKCQNSQG